METLWPGSFVEEANLTVAISLLRKVLGEKEGSLRYIEMVPKKVYRFIAAATEGSAIPPEVVLFGETRIAESLPDLSLRAGNLAPSEVESGEQELAAPPLIPFGLADAITRRRGTSILAVTILGLLVAAALYFVHRKPPASSTHQATVPAMPADLLASTVL
jgi:hypothetical protein